MNAKVDKIGERHAANIAQAVQRFSRHWESRESAAWPRASKGRLEFRASARFARPRNIAASVRWVTQSSEIHDLKTPDNSIEVADKPDSAIALSRMRRRSVACQ